MQRRPRCPAAQPSPSGRRLGTTRDSRHLASRSFLPRLVPEMRGRKRKEISYQREEMSSLIIKDLHVRIGEKEIIRGLSLEIPKGEVHAIMGPNGSGKSTLSKAIGGHPDYTVTSGEVLLDGQNLLELDSDSRSRAGLFLAFQYPMEIPGVSNANFIRAALQARLPEGEELEATDFYQQLYQEMDKLEMSRSFTARS